MMKLFDTHFHYYGEGTPEEFLSTVTGALETPELRQLGSVDTLFLNALGGDYVESCRAREFAQTIPYSWFCAGVHPHQSDEYLKNREDFSVFRNHPRLIGIGELGLDYFYDTSERSHQQKVLEEFLSLALSWDLPAILHLRDKDGCDQAYADGYTLVRDFARSGGRFEVHCFTGPVQWRDRFLELGAFLGVTGAFTFRRADNIRETVAGIPDDRLLIETDSPYLAPVPHRGEPNHPGYVLLVAQALAATRGKNVDEIASQTTGNAFRFFGLDASTEGIEL